MVYGKPALISATSFRLYCSLSQRGEGKSLRTLLTHDAYTKRIISEFEKAYNRSVDATVHLSVSSNIPVGSGMGSSAAYAVALVGALSVWHDAAWNVARIADVSYRAEKEKHANGSGSDTAISAHGGLLWYRKEFESLKTLWLLPFTVPKLFGPLHCVRTKRKETTADLVRHVATVRAKNEQKFILWLSQVESETRTMAESIKAEDAAQFLSCIRKNERLLERVGVVSVSTKKLIKDIEHLGGAAKISGAGGISHGSGTILVSCPDTSALTEYLKRRDLRSATVSLGCEGVRREQVVA